MSRPLPLLAGAALFAGLVLAYGAFAWVETEDRVLGAAEAEGRAVLEAVAAGVRSSLDASAAVDEVLARRLVDLAAQLDTQLADEAGELDEPLQAFVTSHGLRGAVVLSPAMEVRAAASATRGADRQSDGVFDAARIARAEAEHLAATVRKRGWPMGAGAKSITFGFGESPFSARSEYLVGEYAPKLRGFVLLRQDTQDLDAFQARAGVAKLLKEAASGPGIAYLVVQGHDGRVLAANDPSRVGEPMPPASDRAAWQATPGGGRVLDISLPIGDQHLRVGLAADPVDELITHGRRNVLLFAAISLTAGLTTVVLLFLRVRRLAELEERERFESLGRLAAGVAHEIRSPLNALSMAAQRLQREAAPVADPERAKFLELTTALRAGITRLDATIREFLSLGRGGPPPERSRFDVASLVDEVISAEDANGKRSAPATPLVISADRALLAKALANLVRNAHQLAPGTVAVAWRQAGDSVLIEVTDGGPGVAAADRDRIFEPFFTKRAGGTGLGLAIARDAVERQGGRLRVSDAPGGGARFAIELPAEVA